MLKKRNEKYFANNLKADDEDEVTEIFKII